MSDIVIVDSSVLLNVLDIPEFNQDKDDVFDEFGLLGLETGDHVADLSDGGHRRHHATRFRDCIHQALQGEAPWTPIDFPDPSLLLAWLADFPDMAMRKLGLSDVSIIDAWQRVCIRHPHQRVYIWTLHQQLGAYDQRP